MTGLSHFYFYICFFSVCVCLTMWECSYHGALVEVRRQLAQIDCLLLLYEFWGWNWGQQASVARTFTCSAISVTTVLISFKWKMGMERFFHARRSWGSCCWVFSIKKSKVKLCVGGHVSSVPLSVDGESEKLWEHPYQWRSQSWNIPVPDAPGSDSDSASPVLWGTTVQHQMTPNPEINPLIVSLLT